MPVSATFKNGRYTGKGDSMDLVLVGEHAAKDSPFYYLPAILGSADKSYFYRSSNMPGYVAAQWTETLVDVGAGTTAFAEDADGLTLTGAGNEDDGGQTQLLRSFTPAAGKEAVFYFRMKGSEATQYDAVLGWYGVDTTVIASIPTHAAGLRKDDGDTIWNGVTKDGTTASDTANLITDYAADTLYDFAVCIHGVTSVSFHYKLASASTWTRVNKTSNLPTGALRPTIAGLNGEAAADTLTLTRWIIAWQI